MKIIFLGDSLVWGGYGGNFVAEVTQRLPTHPIINAGAGGSTVVNLLARVPEILEQKPDAVFILVGGNEAIALSQPATRPYYEQVQKIPGGFIAPEQFAQDYHTLLEQFLQTGVQVSIGLEPMEYNPATVAALNQFNALAARAAQLLNVPALDLMEQLAPPTIRPRPALNLGSINLIGQRTRSGWSDYESERLRGGFTYSFDGIHFTPETARRVARWVIEFLAL